MIITFIIIWLLCGIIAVWRIYYGFIKHWYLQFNSDLRNEYSHNNMLKILLILSPLFIIGGLISLILFETGFSHNTWYFKIPK